MKLHLGCGNKIIKGFINIDLIDQDGVDLVEDICILESFKEESVDLIYVCHVLEHMKRDEYKKVLKRWFSLLKPGGVLRLSIPNLEEWFKYYSETGDFKTILGALYGGQNHAYNFHYMGWDKKTITEDLLKSGFNHIKDYDWKNIEHSDVKDWSRDYLPYHDKDGIMLSEEVWISGRFMNLNLEAFKI
jgi:predicted SAM-dependent methyltransferase